MVTVVISPVNVVNFPDGGGHFWVFMQYVQGLHQLGCEVYWLERFCSGGDQGHDALVLSTFVKRMERYGLAGKLILYMSHERSGDSSPIPGLWPPVVPDPPTDLPGAMAIRA